MSDKCFVCDRPFRINTHGRVVFHPYVLTADGQRSEAGYDCYRKVSKAGSEGYQPETGGPRLWTVHYAPKEVLAANGITKYEGPTISARCREHSS